MTTIINMTQHTATAEQIAAGVVDLQDSSRESLKALLNFDGIPTAEAVEARAEGIVQLIADEYGVNSGIAAMIGGAPFLMAPPERALIKRGIEPVYAFSRRESVDKHLPGGEVQKVSVFKHLGFYTPNSEKGE